MIINPEISTESFDLSDSLTESCQPQSPFRSSGPLLAGDNTAGTISTIFYFCVFNGLILLIKIFQFFLQFLHGFPSFFFFRYLFIFKFFLRQFLLSFPSLLVFFSLSFVSSDFFVHCPTQAPPSRGQPGTVSSATRSAPPAPPAAETPLDSGQRQVFPRFFFLLFFFPMPTSLIPHCIS